MDLHFEPTKFWGLHYAYKCHYKLYIRDILKMQPYEMFPGAYQYRTYPVYRVDVAGVVVSVDQNARFHIYALDDGTGVIKICRLKDTDADLNTSTQTEQYSLGDYLHIRGKIQMFREETEVFAYDCVRIEDPMFEVLRMMELPSLYTHKYYLPFQVPYKIQQEIKKHESGKAWLCRLLQGSAVTDVMEKCGRFRISDLIADGNITELAPSATIGDIREALSYIIADMELDGAVYALTCDDHTYQLTDGLHCTLKATTIRLLDKYKNRNEEKGIHYTTVWEKLKTIYTFRRIKHSTVLKCLESLESDSKVVSLVSRHFSLLDIS